MIHSLTTPGKCSGNGDSPHPRCRAYPEWGRREILSSEHLRVLRAQVLDHAATWGMAVLWLLLAIAPNPPLLGLALGAMAFAVPIHGIAIVSYRLAVTPDEMRRRVASVARVIAWGTEPVGIALAGVMLQMVGAVQSAFAFGLWSSVIAVGTTLYMHIRNLVTLPRLWHAETTSASDHQLSCSFCGKLAPQVQWLISGRSGAIICSECVRRCDEIIARADLERSDGRSA